MLKRFNVGLLVAVLFLTLTMTGCAAFIIGAGAGIVGGITLSKDSAEGYVDDRMDRVWSVSREVLRDKGDIVLEDRAKGKIEAKVNGVTVKVNIKEITSKTAKLKVSARKKLLPKVSVAQDIYVRIAKRL